MNMVRRDLPNQAQRSATPSAPARPGTAPAAAPQRPAMTMPQRPGQAPQPGARPTMAGGRPIPPSAKADELVMVMRQLAELLAKENAALKKHKMDEVKSLAERKEQLARLYQGHMNAVHKDKNVLAGLESARKNAIAQAAMKLGELMQQNASLLKANIESINMFFKSVTEALKNRHEERSASYSRSGSLGQYAVTKRSLAVSFNQTM